MRSSLVLAAVWALSAASDLRANLFITEAGKVEMYNLLGTDLGQFGAAPTLATGMVMDGQGNLYVGSVGASGKIYKLTSGGVRTARGIAPEATRSQAIPGGAEMCRADAIGA